ncbi:MAG: NADP-dependent oxidoreductase [Deltaproteobacteria bacterium]|nr:NADP-dependent oxidoreductase [Deltaproteobacteria bacterium]
MSQSTENARAFFLEKRPVGAIDDEVLQLKPLAAVELQEGEVRLENRFLSIDPTNRGWMNPQATYLPAIPLGSPMRAIVAGIVVESRDGKCATGTRVSGIGTFATHSVVRGKTLTPLPDEVSFEQALSLFGHIGLTAYFGLTEVGGAKEGDRVFISGAAGATGSTVGQIAKALGCKVYGSAGSDEKCAMLVEELGFDGALNYKTHSTLGELSKAVSETCEKGIDVFFDNVGGDILDAALANLRMKARVVVCGAISQYNADRISGPTNYLALIMARARMEGFVVLDYTPRALEAIGAMLPWLQEGKLKSRVHVLEGLEQVPDGLQRLFRGDHDGKLMVRV